jgi:Nickel responsive protein SCO4226-like
MKGEPMETYVIFRRGGWQSGDDLQEAATRSTAEAELMGDQVRWIRSYVLDEPDGSVGTVCIYEASSPDAIQEHADKANLPADEIVRVVDTVLVRSDPAPASA